MSAAPGLLMALRGVLVQEPPDVLLLHRTSKLSTRSTSFSCSTLSRSCSAAQEKARCTMQLNAKLDKDMGQEKCEQAQVT